MHLIITDARLAKSRVVHLSGRGLALLVIGLVLSMLIAVASLYHWVFLQGAREGWPVIGTLMRLMIKDEMAQRERIARDNLDVLAKQLGEMQAKLVQLESLGERVSGLAGIDPAEIRSKPGRGGELITGRPLSLDELKETMAALDVRTDQRTSLLTVMESRLLDLKLKDMMIPTQKPVEHGNLGSHFGWRIDPISGTMALHSGIDFQGEVGEPIVAAAGGIVVTQEFHPNYGNMIEIDHGKELITRYAHASEVYVKKGDLIKRGQKIAAVGNTGRSTGPHLHFEVRVQGVPQNPQKFLNAWQEKKKPVKTAMAREARASE
ncbi:MAG: M23 family metallopeptidase [Hylemonella sp.]